MKLKPGKLYLGDNGRCFCMYHAGATAQATGCDLSGLPVLELTDADSIEMREAGFTPRCEECGVVAMWGAARR